MEYRGYIIIESNKIEGWFMTECNTICGQSIEEVKYDIDGEIKGKAIDQKVTIYYKGEFGMAVNKVEGRLKDFGTRKWAQYNNAAYVNMIPKRKRKVRGFMQTYNPYLVLVLGWDHADIKDGMEVISDSPSMTVKQSRHMSFSDEWTNEADSVLDAYLEKEEVTVLGDYRETKGFSSYNGKTTTV